MQPNELGDGDSLELFGAQRQEGESVGGAQSPAVWLVLALVIQQPSHGYEIDQRYDRLFGSFLPLSTPRVYAALARLREAGLIERIALRPNERPRKQHGLRQSYRATRAGVQAYRQWVAERMRDDPQRAQILARIASVGLLGIDAVLDVVDRCERECMQDLMALPSDSERLESGDCTPEELTECLVVDQQRRELQARRDWAVYARRVLKARKRRIAAERGAGESS